MLSDFGECKEAECALVWVLSANENNSIIRYLNNFYPEVRRNGTDSSKA